MKLIWIEFRNLYLIHFKPAWRRYGNWWILILARPDPSTHLTQKIVERKVNEDWLNDTFLPKHYKYQYQQCDFNY